MDGRHFPGAPAAAGRRTLLAAIALAGLPGLCQADIHNVVDQLQRLDPGLVDAHGRRFQPRSLRGHVTLVQFLHTRCQLICSDQTQALVELRGQMAPDLRRRVRFVTLSLDPRRDTPAALNAYARQRGAVQAGWHWLTGSPEAIDRLASALLLFPPRPQPGQPAAQARLSAFRQAQQPTPAASRSPERLRDLEAHDKAVWLLDSRGTVRQRFASHPLDIRRLLLDVTGLDQLDRQPRQTGWLPHGPVLPTLA